MLSPANKGRLCFSSQVTSKGPGPFTLPFVLLVSAVFSVNPRLRGLEVAALVGGFSCTWVPPRRRRLLVGVTVLARISWPGVSWPTDLCPASQSGFDWSSF